MTKVIILMDNCNGRILKRDNKGCCVEVAYKRRDAVWLARRLEQNKL